MTNVAVFAGRPPKVEAWLESEIEGGQPVRYDMSRKRPRDADQATGV